MLKRDIIATIGFSKGTVSLTVLEHISASVVEIFNDFGPISKSNAFLTEALAKVEKTIGGKIKTVGVIVEPSEEVKWKINLHKETIRIAGENVSKQDIDNVLELTRRKIETNESKVILVQPTRFEVTDQITKSYSKAPIFKKGETLAITSSVTSISAETHDFVLQVVKAQGLEISQILLTPQAISQNHLSINALISGAVLLHFAENQAFLTVNKNAATVVNMSIYDYGFKDLVQGIVKIFGCSNQEARDLIAAHGTFDDEGDRVIYTRQSGIEEMLYTTSDLTKIITAFMAKVLLEIRNFLQIKKVTNLPIVVSGKVWKIEKLDSHVRNVLQEQHVSVYNPLTFIEMNEKNINTLGLFKFMKAIDEIMGRQFNTIVETNPNTLSNIALQNAKNKWFEKIKNKLGGNHDWN